MPCSSRRLRMARSPLRLDHPRRDIQPRRRRNCLPAFGSMTGVYRRLARGGSGKPRERRCRVLDPPAALRNCSRSAAPEARSRGWAAVAPEATGDAAHAGSAASHNRAKASLRLGTRAGGPRGRQRAVARPVSYAYGPPIGSSRGRPLRARPSPRRRCGRPNGGSGPSSRPPSAPRGSRGRNGRSPPDRCGSG